MWDLSYPEADRSCTLLQCKVLSFLLDQSKSANKNERYNFTKSSQFKPLPLAMQTAFFLHHFVGFLIIMLLYLLAEAAPLFKSRQFEYHQSELFTTSEVLHKSVTAPHSANCPQGFTLKRIRTKDGFHLRCIGFAGISAVSSACGDGFIHSELEEMCYNLTCLTEGSTVDLEKVQCRQKPQCAEERDQFINWTYKNKMCYRNCPTGFRLNGTKCEKKLVRLPFCEEGEYFTEDGMCALP